MARYKVSYRVTFTVSEEVEVSEDAEQRGETPDWTAFRAMHIKHVPLQARNVDIKTVGCRKLEEQILQQESGLITGMAAPLPQREIAKDDIPF